MKIWLIKGNPDIKPRIRDNFPFKTVLIKKEGNKIHGKTWNGRENHTWTKEQEKMD